MNPLFLVVLSMLLPATCFAGTAAVKNAVGITPEVAAVVADYKANPIEFAEKYSGGIVIKDALIVSKFKNADGLFVAKSGSLEILLGGLVSFYACLCREAPELSLMEAADEWSERLLGNIGLYFILDSTQQELSQTVEEGKAYTFKCSSVNDGFQVDGKLRPSYKGCRVVRSQPELDRLMSFYEKAIESMCDATKK